MGELLKNSLLTGPVGELGSVPFTQWESWGVSCSLSGRVGESVVHSVVELGRVSFTQQENLGRVLFTQQENLGVSCSLSGRVGESAIHSTGELGESVVHSVGEHGSALFTQWELKIHF